MNTETTTIHGDTPESHLLAELRRLSGAQPGDIVVFALTPVQPHNPSGLVVISELDANQAWWENDRLVDLMLSLIEYYRPDTLEPRDPISVS